MRRHLRGDRAWGVLLLSVLLYEYLAPDDELLSHACDRFRIKHPIITHILILSTAGHLLRRVPAQMDLLTFLVKVRKIKRNW